jgi:hypothetical protein
MKVVNDLVFKFTLNYLLIKRWPFLVKNIRSLVTGLTSLIKNFGFFVAG